MNKIEFENGSIIKPIGDVGQTIRSKIKGTYIDAEEKKPFFEGYNPNYYFNNVYEDLAESQIKYILSKAIFTGKDKYASCDSISKPITLEDLEGLAEKLNQLPPSPIGMEVGSKFALDMLLKNIPITKETKGISFINEISVSIVEDTDLKFNQMKIKFSDGSDKIMDIFNKEEK